jgi:hypothetical protein
LFVGAVEALLFATAVRDFFLVCDSSGAFFLVCNGSGAFLLLATEVEAYFWF